MKTDLDQLIIDCRAALGEEKPRAALREVLQRAVSRPGELMEALPAPRQQGVVVHVADDLTILQVVNDDLDVVAAPWSRVPSTRGPRAASGIRDTTEGAYRCRC